MRKSKQYVPRPVSILEDEMDAILFERTYALNLRAGPCEDDTEITAPYIGILPDESDCEEVSTLKF